jgi:hypothetical protein
VSQPGTAWIHIVVLAGSPSIESTMTNFYQALFVKMFTLLNPQYTLTQSYIRCMHGQMIVLKPFGGAHAKMQRQVSHISNNSTIII